MHVQITQQERKDLEDHRRHEEVCIQKYDEYAQRASDPELRSMFAQFASQERQHYDSLDRLLQGQQPITAGGSGQGQQQNRTSLHDTGQNRGGGTEHNDDALMCRDAMMMERFISGSYDNGIFGSTNSVVRQTLQHIQDEEQQHGEGLLAYMQRHGLQSQ